MPLMPLVMGVAKKKLADTVVNKIGEKISGQDTTPKTGLGDKIMSTGFNIMDGAIEHADNRLKQKGIDLSLLGQDPLTSNTLIADNNMPEYFRKNQDGSWRIEEMADLV